MLIGIPKEQLENETRVAATPTSVIQLKKLGFDVIVEQGAGLAANFDDNLFLQSGAQLSDSVLNADIIFKVNAPTDSEIKQMKPGTILISFVWPAQHPDLVDLLAKQQITVLAMDMVPRISRAQSLDALSSMANISGYRAVVEAAHEFGRFFTGQITAAGKVPPAKVLVIGAGVAGLAAIGSAGSLGAIVRAFDTRLEVAEQIESMGGQFLKLEFDNKEGDASDGYAKVMSDEFIAAEMALFAEQAKDVDIIITTAQIPGKTAPKLISSEMVASMKSGSVIVDLAAGSGGNVEPSVAGKKIITDNGVTVIGYTDLASRLASQSSQLYSTNLVNLMKLLCKQKDGQVALDFDDVVTRNMTVTHQSEIMFPPPPISVSAAPSKPKVTEKVETQAPKQPSKTKYVIGTLGIAAFMAIAATAPADFLSHFTVFILSCIVGYYVVWNVSHSLHTPLMSVTNAISGIIVVGALLQIGHDSLLIKALAFFAVLIASINIFGGFTVTQRMLKMFRKG
ncbi:Re/Si-specific NAD(P)(+) transhydrogenase subunit alpha [Parashewanella spongiae]|uniref:NAD(P) transhydrogenase subunit alpha n=1 Tax=Parashewanella spongiae TaxID=342950 RepID=A0A3A6U8P5_9GAMM|nr:Re/Si-specific NAD(P)(+) transhydrogenase subunit alpha [Parashewanella spongiae]MCL1079203.1 Re/Si-specific NAD(P)(+) transhydrogenase subunit alpha [Parashewanella spongiae]RJY17862.1 Re/Si-specific NAD(P)(+) transhydrogenase subunit alpha [Parashewanella spongiae]